MRKSIHVFATLCTLWIAALPMYASATQYTIFFTTASGSPTPTGSFTYDPTLVDSFSNFVVQWAGIEFNFTSVANNAGAAQIFENPICANGKTGASATFYLLTECPQAGWSAGSQIPASTTFSFGETDTMGANVFDLAVTEPIASAGSAQGTFASFARPEAVYISDSQNNRIRVVNTSGVIATSAGDGVQGFSGDTGLATNGELHTPFGIALDGAGNIYIADTLNNRIREVNTSGIITTIAGTGSAAYGGDGSAAVYAQLNHPMGVAVDMLGNLYIADEYNNRIRRVDTGGTITTVVGNGTVGSGGDGGTATSAQLYYPTGVAVDGSYNLYIADSDNQRIRKVDNLGKITTIAGSGQVGYSCANGIATSVGLHTPTGVAVDGKGDVFIADYGNQCIRKVDSLGNITTVAGDTIPTYGGDDGPATDAALNYPTGVAVDSSGILYIADYVNNRVRVVNASGIIATLAGDGTAGYYGDGELASGAQLYQPTGVAVGPAAAAPPP